jgi:DNA-binding transcriptional MerR regulator
MRIGELSEATGVAAPLLRYYEAKGLLRPARAPNGYRDYDDDAVEAVSQVRGLLAAGLSTDEIAQLLPCATSSIPDLDPCPEVLDLLRGRTSALDERIGALTAARDALEVFVRAVERAAASKGRVRCARPT